jgi:hypothetical protein
MSGSWETVVIRRHGAPPLRFAGRAVCAESDRDLSVRIWRAKMGGFILAHSVETPGAETASRHAEAEGVMRTLESFCRDLDASGDMPIDLRKAGRLHAADLLEEMARLSDWRRRFRALAGEVLDAFDGKLGAVAPEPERERGMA